MSLKHSASFERALRVEMLRARAALERDAICRQAERVRESLDPRQQLMSLLPRDASGLIGQLGQLAFRYPFLLSSAVSIVSTQLKRPRWLLLAGAAALSIWIFSQGRGGPRSGS